jgi:hypothetical protein
MLFQHQKLEFISIFVFYMKYLTILLSTYILALSFVTCSDTVANKLMDKESVELTQDFDHGNHSHSEEADVCSPFCSCQCCQVTVDVFKLSTFNLRLELILLEEISSINHDISQDVLQSLYQPPIV